MYLEFQTSEKDKCAVKNAEGSKAKSSFSHNTTYFAPYTWGLQQEGWTWCGTDFLSILFHIWIWDKNVIVQENCECIIAELQYDKMKFNQQPGYRKVAILIRN